LYLSLAHSEYFLQKLFFIGKYESTIIIVLGSGGQEWKYALQ